MLEHVLKTIEGRGESAKQEILLARELALKKLEDDFKDALQTRKAQQKALLKNNTEFEIQEAAKKQGLAARFANEKKKKELLDSVYKSAENKILKLDDQKFVSLIESFLENIPSKGGVFKAGKKTAEVLKKKGIAVKEITVKEGFMFESEKLDIDCTLEQFIARQRERLDPKLNEVLFEKYV